MPQVGLALVGGATTLGVAATLAIQIGASLAFSAIAQKKARSAANRGFGTELYISGDPNDPRYIVYGRAWTAGTLRYRNATGTDNRELYLVIVLAGHECDAVESVQAGRETLTLDGSGNVTSPSKWVGRMNVRFLLGTDSQSADSTLDTAFANWTSNHRLRGCTYAIVKLTYDEQELNSLPDFRFLVRGRKVYDPRLDSTNGGSGAHRLATPSTWAWSENPVLCHNDYWRGVLINSIRIAGPGVSSGRFHWPNVIAEANVCDENVSLAAGGTEERYTSNGIIDPRSEHGEVLEMFEQSFAGDIAFSDGKWRYFAGAYRAPTLALTADHFVGPLRIVVHKGESDRRDTAHGRFSSLAEAGTTVSYSPVSLSTAVAGSERVTNVDMQLVNDLNNAAGYDGGARAQRIAKLLLERDQAGKLLTCTTNLYGLRAVPGESIGVTHAAFGLSAQTMRVMDVALRAVQDGDKAGLVVDLLLGAGPSSLYTWSAEETAIGAAPTLPQSLVPWAGGTSSWTPILVNVSRLGSSFTKTGGAASTWDSSVYSQEGYNAVAVSFRASQTGSDIMVGLNTDPTTDHNYTSLDFAFRTHSNGNAYIYESGVDVTPGGSLGAYSTSDQFTITYDGVMVRYYKNATLLKSVSRIGARLFLDSSFYTSGGAINSVAFGPISRADSISGNLLRPEAWAVGDVPTAGLGNFLPNETATDENQVIATLAGPHGHSQLLWEGRCTDPGTGSAGDANGGWENIGDVIGLDPARTYRSTVWFRFTESATNQFYHGCGTLTGETRDLDGTANTNPYFVVAIPLNDVRWVPGKWYLSVGVIHGSGYGTASSGISGVYDPETGQRIIAGTDFKMGTAATTQRHRTYMYYGGNTSVRAYWTEPRFEVIDGNEPPISALLTAGGGLEWRRDGVHDELWYADAAQLHRSWTKREGGVPDSEITLLTGLTDAPGGQAMRFGNNSSTDGWWGAFTGWLMAYDPASTYEIGVVVRRNSGSGLFYCGLEGVANDGVTWINSAGSNSYGTQHYVAANGLAPGSSWTTYRGYVRGHSGTAGGLANNPSSPAAMYTGVAYIRPMMIINYNNVAGQMDVAALWVRRLPTIGTPNIGPNAATDVVVSQPSDGTEAIGFISYSGGGTLVDYQPITDVSWENTTGESIDVLLRQSARVQLSASDALIGRKLAMRWSLNGGSSWSYDGTSTDNINVTAADWQPKSTQRTVTVAAGETIDVESIVVLVIPDPTTGDPADVQYRGLSLSVEVIKR